jgi:hypothetical protein
MSRDAQLLCSSDTGMTLDLLLRLLRSHLAALQSTAWPPPHGASNGPALFLDAAETSALIGELTGLLDKERARAGPSG